MSQTCEKFHLDTVDGIIKPICKFGKTGYMDFFLEGWLILLRGRIQDIDGHKQSDHRIMNFISTFTKIKLKEF